MAVLSDYLPLSVKSACALHPVLCEEFMKFTDTRLSCYGPSDKLEIGYITVNEMES